MGIKVKVQTERCEAIDVVIDPHNLLHRLLPSADDHSYQLLRFIDWYGDTVFNRLQMDLFLEEWRTLHARAQSPEERELLRRVEQMGVRCKEEILYLRFQGD